MGYLILKFKNANLIKVDGKNKNHVLIHGGNNPSFEKVSNNGHDFINPIPFTLVSNILHCLCGEIPVPSNKKSLFKRNEVYDNIAKNSYIKYDNKPIFSEKGYIYNTEIFQTKKWQFDSTMKYSTIFRLYDGSEKTMSGHYNWDIIKRSFYDDDYNDLINFIHSVIHINPITLSFPQVIYELSKFYKDETFAEKVKSFYEVHKGMRDGKKRFPDWTYDLFFNYKVGKGKGDNLPLKSSRTPLLINNGIGEKFSLSGTIISEITDEIADKIRQNKGVANLLEFGLIYVAGYEKYEPVSNYKEIYERIY